MVEKRGNILFEGTVPYRNGEFSAQYFIPKQISFGDTNAEVQAFASHATRGHPVEDTVAINLRFANGVLGTFMLSDCAASPRSWEQTAGENKSYDHHADEDRDGAEEAGDHQHTHFGGHRLGEDHAAILAASGRNSAVAPFTAPTASTPPVADVGRGHRAGARCCRVRPRDA